jgi:hypothetical protein
MRVSSVRYHPGDYFNRSESMTNARTSGVHSYAVTTTETRKDAVDALSLEFASARPVQAQGREVRNGAHVFRKGRERRSCREGTAAQITNLS